MFAQVVLHRRVPGKFESFTYRVPEGVKIEPGQLVTVPFRAQRIAGIVRSLHSSSPSYAVRELEQASKIILPKWQFELAVWITKNYAAPFSKVIDHFIPERVWPAVKSRPQKTDSMPAIKIKEPAPHPSSPAIDALCISILSGSKPKLLIERSRVPRPEFYNALKNQLKEKQMLILLPELFHLNACAAQYAHFHGSLKEWEKARIWELARNSNNAVFAGTRAALFLPFKNLGAIVLDYEHNENYSEKRAPYHHTADVALKISELLKIPLIMISPAPRAETWHMADQGKILSMEYHSKENPTVAIIDMADEKRSGNSNLLALRSLEAISSALAKKHQALLFVNRTGEAGGLICRDCGHIERCALCNSPLAPHRGLALKCHRCKTEKQTPEACASCGGVKLRPIGAGTEKIESEISSAFGRARVIRVESETKMNLAAGELDSSDIIVATRIIDKPLNLPRLETIIAVAPDALINLPDFRAEERLLQLLASLKLLARPDGKIIIQAFLSGHRVYTTLAKNTIAQFYDNELKTRAEINLPPFEISRISP